MSRETHSQDTNLFRAFLLLKLAAAQRVRTAAGCE